MYDRPKWGSSLHVPWKLSHTGHRRLSGREQNQSRFDKREEPLGKESGQEKTLHLPLPAQPPVPLFIFCQVTRKPLKYRKLLRQQLKAQDFR